MQGVAARIVSHTTDTDTDTKLTNYLGSAQTKFMWHDGRYTRVQMDRGGADACAFERGGAEARPDSGYQMESFMSPTTLKMLSKG